MTTPSQNLRYSQPREEYSQPRSTLGYIMASDEAAWISQVLRDRASGPVEVAFALEAAHKVVEGMALAMVLRDRDRASGSVEAAFAPGA